MLLSEGLPPAHAGRVTVTDPHVGSPGPVRSWRRVLLIGLAGMLLLVGVSTVNRERRGTPRPLPTAPATPTPTPFVPVPFRHGVAAPRTASLPVQGAPIDLAGGGYLLALTSAPSRIYRLSSQPPLSWVAQQEVPAGSFRLVPQSEHTTLYLLGHVGDMTSIEQLDPLSLEAITSFAVPFEVEDAVASYQALWLAADDGLHVLPTPPAAPAGAPRLVVRGTVQAMAIDELDNRIVVALTSPTGVTLRTFALDSAKPGPTTAVALDRLSMAVESDDLWLAGTGTDARGHLAHLNATTLHPIIAGPYQVYGVLIRIWPGDLTVWVAGDAEVACLARTDGAVLTTSDGINGPLVTTQGYAFALAGGSIRSLELTQTACERG